VARLARAPLQLVVTRLEGESYRLDAFEPIEPGPEDAVARALGRQASALLRRHPGDWWLWPYVVPAPPGRQPGHGATPCMVARRGVAVA